MMAHVVFSIRLSRSVSPNSILSILDDKKSNTPTNIVTTDIIFYMDLARAPILELIN